MTPPIVPALVAHARRRIVTDLTDCGATSPDRAVAYRPRNSPIDRGVFRRMRNAGAVVETSPGSFYLDQAGLDAYRASMRRRVGVIAAIGAVAAGLLVLGG